MIAFALAFAAGLLAFFAACLLPVIPAYFAYLASLALQENTAPDSESYPAPPWLSSGCWVNRRRALLNSLLFVLGFVGIFTLLGLSASAIGQWLAINRLILKTGAAIFLIILGAGLLGIIKRPSLLAKSWQLPGPQKTRWRNLTAFVFGLTFGLAWTPCIGPVLAGILLLASQAGTLIQGALLLAVFGLGLGLPFIIIGGFFQGLISHLPKLAKWSRLINIIAGLVIIVIGGLLLFNKLGSLSAWFWQWSKG